MSSSQSVGGSGVSTKYMAVSIRKATVFVPGLLEFHVYGGISENGIFSSPVQRDLDVGPRANFRRALAA